MRKWQVSLIAIILSVSLVGVLSVLIYKYYIVPRYMEPIVQDISDFVNQEEILDKLYSEAKALHESGMMDDSIYASFMRAYNESKRDDLEYANRVLEAHNSEDTLDTTQNSRSTKYASYKVGVEIIKVNDTDSNGKADVNYSDERTSERVKAEDVVEAEKIIEEAENSGDATPTPKAIESAYDKLRVNMTADEFSAFTKIMRKLDVETIKSYMTDKEGLKAYLHQKLTDDEYRQCVNLGYKYVYLFIED